MISVIIAKPFNHFIPTRTSDQSAKDRYKKLNFYCTMQHNVRFNGSLDVDIGGHIASLVQNNDDQPCTNRIRAARRIDDTNAPGGQRRVGSEQINTRFRIPATPRAFDCPGPDT